MEKACRWSYSPARNIDPGPPATGRPKGQACSVCAPSSRSYERIHRSNLVGMGVLPLQFPDGQSVASLGLAGHETFDLAAVDDGAATVKPGRRPPCSSKGGAHRHAEGMAVLPSRGFCKRCCARCEQDADRDGAVWALGRRDPRTSAIYGTALGWRPVASERRVGRASTGSHGLVIAVPGAPGGREMQPSTNRRARRGRTSSKRACCAARGWRIRRVSDRDPERPCHRPPDGSASVRGTGSRARGRPVPGLQYGPRPSSARPVEPSRSTANGSLAPSISPLRRSRGHQPVHLAGGAATDRSVCDGAVGRANRGTGAGRCPRRCPRACVTGARRRSPRSPCSSRCPAERCERGVCGADARIVVGQGKHGDVVQAVAALPAERVRAAVAPAP